MLHQKLFLYPNVQWEGSASLCLCTGCADNERVCRLSPNPPMSGCECILFPFPHPNPSFMRVWQRVCPWAPLCVCVCVHGIMINSCFWTLPDYRGVFKPVSNGSSLLGRPALLHLPTCTQGSLHTYIHIKMHTCILTWTHTRTLIP